MHVLSKYNIIEQMIRNSILLLVLTLIIGQSLHSHEIELDNVTGCDHITVLEINDHPKGLCPACLTSTYKSTNKLEQSIIFFKQFNYTKLNAKDFLFSDLYSYQQIPSRAPPKV